MVWRFRRGRDVGEIAYAEKRGELAMKTMHLGILVTALSLPAFAQSVATYTPPASTAAAAIDSSQPAGLERMESLGMGDMVRITVFRNPDLTTEARVSERGTI